MYITSKNNLTIRQQNWISTLQMQDNIIERLYRERNHERTYFKITLLRNTNNSS